MGGEGGNALGACEEEITGDGPLSLMKGEGGRRGGEVGSIKLVEGKPKRTHKRIHRGQEINIYPI